MVKADLEACGGGGWTLVMKINGNKVTAASKEHSILVRLKVSLKIYNYISKRQTPMPLTPQQQKL